MPENIHTNDYTHANEVVQKAKGHLKAVNEAITSLQKRDFVITVYVDEDNTIKIQAVKKINEEYTL